MSYTAERIEKLVQISTTEVAHAGRLDGSIQFWNAYIEQLYATAQNLTIEAQNTAEQWPDPAGEKFKAATDASLKSIKGKLFAATHQEVRELFNWLKTEISTADAEVQAAYAEYLAAIKNDPMADVAALARAASQRAGAALDKLAKSYVTVANSVRKASGPGISWVEPAAGTGPAAPGGPATSAAPGGPGSAPSGAPSGGAPAGGAPAGGAPAGGAPAAGGDPALAGGAAPAPAAPPPTSSVPPPVAPKPLPPLVPPILPAASIAPPKPVGPVVPRGGKGVGALGALDGMAALPGAASPKAPTTSGSLPPAVPPPPPSTGTAAAAPKPGASNMIPPMAPPLHGGHGNHTAPKPGAADPASRRTGRAPKTVPGVPESLRGRAGKLDAQQAFLFPAGRPKPEEHDSDTVEFVDEDLWRVAESGPSPIADHRG